MKAEVTSINEILEDIGEKGIKGGKKKDKQFKQGKMKEALANISFWILTGVI